MICRRRGCSVASRRRSTSAVMSSSVVLRLFAIRVHVLARHSDPPAAASSTIRRVAINGLVVQGTSAMTSFVYEHPATRVIFGDGVLDRLGGEVERLGARRALVLATPRQRATPKRPRGGWAARSRGVYAEAVMHVPIETARAARAVARRLEADCCVAIGGGSTIGLAKAIALESAIADRRRADHLRRLGDDADLRSDRRRSQANGPRSVRCCRKRCSTTRRLTVTLPPRISGPSGHERDRALRRGAVRAGRQSDHFADGGRRDSRARPVAAASSSKEPADLDGRADALYGAWLAGSALGATSMSIHHKLCHTLGGTFNLPHAEVHTVILPHAVAFNRERGA